MLKPERFGKRPGRVQAPPVSLEPPLAVGTLGGRMKWELFEEKLRDLREALVRDPTSAAPALAELEALLDGSRSELRERAEIERVRESELRRYRELFALSPDAYLVTDMRGGILEANIAGALLLHAPQPQLIGKPLLVFVAPEQRRPFRAAFLRFHSGEPVVARDVPLQPRKGPRFLAAIRMTAVRDGRGRP